jgi:DNA primase
LADDWESLIKQVKEANDIVDVVGRYVALRPAGGTFKGLCPFHEDHRPSFDVDPRRQRYRCWSCGKYGDVLSFVQEHDRVVFRDALEQLARWAGITLKKAPDSPQQRNRALMLDAVRWAAEQYHQCLLGEEHEPAVAEAARHYLGERGLAGETVRRFGLGFAPADGTWLVKRANRDGVPAAVLEQVGLIAARPEGRGWYDRFRDRVMFPIRNARGQVVGFGGRILPGSAYADRAMKYYNSSDTELFSKSELLYGLDEALKDKDTTKSGTLAVVEGYTDVLMAHQCGVGNVVATMGTALNARHVQHLQRWVRRVVLVFDADPGGETGVDRALAVFASQNVDLAVAMLPVGLDPCDLLVQQGADAFRQVLAGATDALEFKLTRMLAGPDAQTVEGRRRAVDAVLRVIALAPDIPGHEGAVKRELMMTRIARRLALQEETVWARLRELRREVRRDDREPPRREELDDGPEGKRAAPAAPEERQLLQMLLADSGLVKEAVAQVSPDQIAHPGLRQLLQGLYVLYAEGAVPTLDALRARVDNPALMAYALRMQEVGHQITDRSVRFGQLMEEFCRRHRVAPARQELHNQLHAATDHAAALDLLRRLQGGHRTSATGPRPDEGPSADAGSGR